GLANGRISLGAQHYRVGAIDPDQTQLAYGFGDRFGVMKHVGGQCPGRVTGRLADALDAGGRIAFEYRTGFGKGNLAGRILNWLPVRVTCAALDVVNRLSAQLEGRAQLHQCLDLSLSGYDAVAGRLDVTQVPGADGRELGTAGPLDVHHSASGEMAL